MKSLLEKNNSTGWDSCLCSC